MEFIKSCDNLFKLRADGFVVAWPNPPSEKTLKEIILNSQHFVLAVENDRVVGERVSGKNARAVISLLHDRFVL